MRSKYTLEGDYGLAIETVIKDEKSLYRKARLTREILGVKKRLPYTRTMAEFYNVPITEEATITDFIIIGKEAIRAEKRQHFGTLFVGDNPHYQLIQQIVGTEGRVTEGALIKTYIIKERYLPYNKSGLKYFKTLLKRMRSRGYLLKETEQEGKNNIVWYKPGMAVKTLNKRIMEAKSGYDPNILAIWDYINYFVEGVTYNDIRRYMINNLKWIETLHELDMHLNYMKMKGYLVEYYGNIRTKRQVEPFGKVQK